MSTMAQIIDATARAFARKDIPGVHRFLVQAAAKVGGDNGARIHDVLMKEPPAQTLAPLMSTSTGGNLWQAVAIGRSPWVPPYVQEKLDGWLLEMQHAEALEASGERVRPLLMVGPPRCGKTSSAGTLATRLGRKLARLDGSSIVGSHLGETARTMRSAFDSARWMSDRVCLIDEIDGLAPHREGSTAGDKERNHTIACMLTWLEELPATMALVATTNRLDAVDPAVAARMTVVDWPSWNHLSMSERAAFAGSHHGHEWLFPEQLPGSYAAVVEQLRAVRVGYIISRESQAKRHG